MKLSKKLLCFVIIALLASLVGVPNPVQSQDITQQSKLVVFESVGSTT